MREEEFVQRINNLERRLDALRLPESPIIGGDAFLKQDGAGVQQRRNNWVTPTTHFNEWSGWAWAAYGGFVTPANVDIVTYKSIAMVWNSAANGIARAFAYRTAGFSGVSRVICSIAMNSQRTGVRMDDGTNNNYAELWVDPDGTGLVRLWYRYAVGAAVTGPTQLWASHGQPQQWYDLMMVRYGDVAYMYAGVNVPQPAYITAATIAGWNPQRNGIYHELTAAIYDSARSSMFDLFYG